MERRCLACNKILEGRVDKIYCSGYCKSSYHYEKNKLKALTRFQIVNEQLKRNRTILKHFHKSGMTTIRKDELEAKGFNPNFFTNYWRNSKKDIYFFCYEYGFLKLKSTNKDKYLIIDWQPYMEK